MVLHRSSVLGTATMSPIALGEGFGLLHRADGPVRCGVVLCSPWGIDELSARKVLVRLATRLAHSGIPALRFDYPGTADAIDRPAAGFGAWVDTAADAADRLKAACGVETIVFAGIGIGATIALLASARRDDVAALVLAAPVVGGRRYLREIALGAPVVESALGLEASQRPDGVSIGGIVMPAPVAGELRSIDLLASDVGASRPVLVVSRPSQPQDAALADHLATLGWPVDRMAFEGYEAAMDNPTISVMPAGVIDAITAWVGDTAPTSGSSPIEARMPAPVLFETAHGTEEAIAFAHGLFGLLTYPAERGTTPTVVFLNSGYDHHAGWAYQWARTARTLAAQGIPSLRFDMANIGDAAARHGDPEQVLYGEGQQADIAAALDMLAERGETSVVLVGRCSGAFAAFHAAARDARIAAAVVINPLRMVWDPDEDVEVAIRIGPRSMADYRRRALSRRTFQRLIGGDIHLAGAIRGLGTHLLRRVTRIAAPLIGSLSKITRLRRRWHALMTAISGRGTALHFVCSERDASLEQMAFYFGSDLSGLRNFPHASLTRVPDADHNMTPEAAHDMVANVVLDAVLRSRASSGTVTGLAPGTTAPDQFAGAAERIGA